MYTESEFIFQNFYNIKTLIYWTDTKVFKGLEKSLLQIVKKSNFDILYLGSLKESVLL